MGMNDGRLEERKRACDCDPKDLLAKEREYMPGFGDSRLNYVYCSKHGLLVPFEFQRESSI